MSPVDLSRKVATLETQNDHLMTELNRMNELLVAVGFPEGLRSVKAVAEEILENGEEFYE